MKNIIFYWTMSGNTESIANKLASDLNSEAINVNDANIDNIEAENIILGCPAMGQEELDLDEFVPFYEKIVKKYPNKNYLLFGSYGWGDGEFMRTWKENALKKGLNVLGELIVCGDESNIISDEYDNFIKLAI